MNVLISAEAIQQRVRSLAVDGASDEEICEICRVSESVLLEMFAGVLREARAQRRVLLRRLQNAAAKKGNAQILSLLGKNELGQDGKERAGDDRWPEPQLDAKVG